MEELIDLIVSDESPSQISDGIKDILFAKAAEKVNSVKPEIAATFFNSND
jgi:hypothetical protein